MRFLAFFSVWASMKHVSKTYVSQDSTVEQMKITYKMMCPGHTKFSVGAFVRNFLLTETSLESKHL